MRALSYGHEKLVEKNSGRSSEFVEVTIYPHSIHVATFTEYGHTVLDLDLMYNT